MLLIYLFIERSWFRWHNVKDC